MLCPRCHQSVRDEARFCDSCGFSIGSLVASHQSPSELAETMKAADPLIGHVIDSKYQIIEQLGKGGMGIVYRAERVLVGDEVALKILRGEFVADEETVARFRREARAAARLRHPNVVTIYDYGEARGADAPAYIVMELLAGCSLREILKREGRLEPERAVQLMRGICAGIGLAHRRQIVHRDIKPDNIILLPPDEEEGREQETVKVVDFGIAKLRDAATGGTLTQRGFQPGTIHYMSPEQCRGDQLDARSDVYSLGALLYEMLTGRPPFIAETQTGLISKHLFDPPSPFAKELRISLALESVVTRALAKEPDARQEDAGALGRELLEAEQQELEAQRRKEEEEQRQERGRLEAEERERRQAEAQAAEQAEAQRRREEQERLRLEAEKRRHAAEEEARRKAAEEAAQRQREEAESRARDAKAARRREEESHQPDTAPARAPDTAPNLTQPAPTKLAPQTGTRDEKIENVSLTSLGLADVEPARKRGTGIWIVLGVIAAVALSIFAAIKLFSSSPAAETTQSTSKSAANSPAPPSSPSAVALNYKPVGNPLRTKGDRFKVALSPDGQRLVSTSPLSSPAPAPMTNAFDVSGSSSIAYSPDGKLLAVGREDGLVVMKDANELSHEYTWSGHKDYVFLVALSGDGKTLVSASGDKTVRVWNTQTRRQEFTFTAGADDLIVTVDPDRLTVALFNPETKGVSLSSIDGRGATRTLTGHNAEVSCGAFSLDGQTLALGDSNGRVQLWRTSDGSLIREHQSPARGEVGSVLFSPDGQFLAIGWDNGDIELRRTSDGASAQTLKGHTRAILILSFSSDGRVLASGAEDKTIRLWQNEEFKE